MTNVNFFWKGPNFGFLEMIVVLSHIKVGHNPILWLSGKEPMNPFWENIKKNVILNDANEICNIEKFISDGGNFRTASALWRFNFLFLNGGLYCDSDAFALKKFPNDDWIVCSENNDDSILSIGVLKAPPHQSIFSDCIKKIKKDWGNVNVFTNCYKDYFGNSIPTHNSLLFYPYKWKNCEILLNNVEIPPNSYSVHFYTRALQDYILKKNKTILSKVQFNKGIRSIEEINEVWCSKNPKTLLGRLFSWLNQ